MIMKSSRVKREPIDAREIISVANTKYYDLVTSNEYVSSKEHNVKLEYLSFMAATPPHTTRNDPNIGKKIENWRKNKTQEKLVENGLVWRWCSRHKQLQHGFPAVLYVMSHTPENHENYKKKIRDRNSVYRITAEKSKAEAKRLSQISDGAYTPPPKMIMTDHLKQVLMTGNNQWSEDKCQDFISQVELHSLKE